MRTTIRAAKTDLSGLIKRAGASEEIVIGRGHARAGRLVRMTAPPRKRVFGSRKGKARTNAVFFERLPASELDAWEN